MNQTDTDTNRSGKPLTRIFLVGMPGAGKSTLGKKLAVTMNLPFADLDTEIEKETEMSVPEIFREKGEPFFRAVESRILKMWATAEKGFVLATGGGAPCHHEGMRVINQNGLSIFLDVPVEELLRRVKAEEHRPLLGGAEKEVSLRNLLRDRGATYATAHVTVTMDHTVDEIVSLILSDPRLKGHT